MVIASEWRLAARGRCSMACATFSSEDVLRFLGRRILHGNFKGEVTSDFKDRTEGVRIKHRVKDNSIKAYDKGGSVWRVETTMNDPRDFKVLRKKHGESKGKASWRPYPGVSPMCTGALRSASLPMNATSRLWPPPIRPPLWVN